MGIASFGGTSEMLQSKEANNSCKLLSKGNTDDERLGTTTFNIKKNPITHCPGGFLQK